MLHDRHVQWLGARGIEEATALAYGLHTHRDESGVWLRVPYVESGKVVNHKWRRTSEKAHRMDIAAPLTLWNVDAILAHPDQPVIVCEGEWDALATIQSGFPLTTSVPNGADEGLNREEGYSPWDAKRYEWAHRHRSILDGVKQFILATDDDEPGRVLASDLARLLGPERCRFVSYPDGCKDLNEVLATHGEEGVRQVLGASKPYPVRGLYLLSDFPEPPDFHPMRVGIDGLSDLFPLVTGTFSVITGWAGHGKTSLLMVMLANLLRAGVPMALGSFETMPKPVLQRKLRAAIYRVDDRNPKVFADGPADEMMEKLLRIISNSAVNDETELTIETVIELAIVAVIRDGIRLLVLDPWNEMEHKRGLGENETEYVGRAIRLLKRFARDYQCAVWIVAHPRKPMTDGNPKPPSLYDLAGSANFANKADYGLVCHRDDLAGVQTSVRLVKKRMGLPGRMGVVRLAYNELTNSYDLEPF